MSSLSSSYRWRRRTQSFGSYGSCKEQSALEKTSAVEKPELIEGYAHICFNDEGSWLRGSLVTADGTAYNLAGHKVEGDVYDEPDGHAEGKASPDIVRDFPSPLRSHPGSGELSRTTSSSAVVAKEMKSVDSAARSSSRQNSMDGNLERELQFILEDFPTCNEAGNGESVTDPVTSSSPTDSITSSRPGSPPTSQQILKALDNLLIREQSANLELKTPNSNPSSPSLYNKNNMNMTPFRSRSSSRSMADRPPVSAVFDITVSDLEEGAEHHIRRVNSRNGQNCTLRCRQLCFVTEKTFWGQRADLVIQKQLAAPELVGQGCHVFAGPMRFYFNRQVQPLSASFSNPRWCW